MFQVFVYLMKLLKSATIFASSLQKKVSESKLSNIKQGQDASVDN